MSKRLRTTIRCPKCGTRNKPLVKRDLPAPHEPGKGLAFQVIREACRRCKAPLNPGHVAVLLSRPLAVRGEHPDPGQDEHGLLEA